MSNQNKTEIDRILNNESILHTDQVRSDLTLNSKPLKTTLLHTGTRLILYCHTPMGLQITVIRYNEVEHVTSGKTKGKHYVQLLGNGARVLILFESKSSRETYKDLCMTIVIENGVYQS